MCMYNTFPNIHNLQTNSFTQAHCKYFTQAFITVIGISCIHTPYHTCSISPERTAGAQ